MKIKVTKNGPYKIEGDADINREEIVADEEGTSCRYKKTGEVNAKGSCSLCRCGQSKNKPFCDGTHITNDFKCDDADPKEKFDDTAEIYEGEKYNLCDCEKLCASARFCHRAGSAWKLVTKPDEESEEILKEEIRDCPSGRLVLKNKKTGEIVEMETKEGVSLIEDKPSGCSGPIWVKGGVEIESPEGKTYEKRNRVTLCRCGKSKNKPFCDGSHIASGFKE